MKLKDLFKPGRNIFEYIDEDGNQKKSCISCGRRFPIAELLPGDYLCKNKKIYLECNSINNYPFWIPRVDYTVLKFIKKDDFNV